MLVREELDRLLHGGVDEGTNIISSLVETISRLVAQELLEGEQAAFLGGRGRYERRGAAGGGGLRNGYERGRIRTAEGAVDVRLPQVRGAGEPYRSTLMTFLEGNSGVLDRRQRLQPPRQAVDRLQGEWPTLRLIHLPVRASWLDQCEIYFSIVQRKVVNPNDFTDLDQIADRLAVFEERSNTVAEPFEHRRPRHPSRVNPTALPTIGGDADPRWRPPGPHPPPRPSPPGTLA